MFGPKSGSWWVRSKKDPRWNGGGSTESLMFSSGPPPEVEAHIRSMVGKYGKKPKDLEWGGMKD
jgi:hypothetical protein